MYRLRIQRKEGGWIIGGLRYSRERAVRRADELRAQGHVVHVDQSGPGWHASPADPSWTR